MEAGLKYSLIGHGAVIALVALEGLFGGRAEPPLRASADVTILTAEEFAALFSPSEAPPLPRETEARAEPEPEAPRREGPPAEPPPPREEAPRIEPPAEPERVVEPEPEPEPEPVVEPEPEVALLREEPQEAPRAEAPVTGAPEATPRARPRPERREQQRETPRETARPERQPQPERQEPPRETAPSLAEQIAAAVAEVEAERVGQQQQPSRGPVEGPPLTEGERDALRIAVRACWNIGSLSSEAQRITVTLVMNMQPDGRPVAESIRLVRSSDPGNATATRNAFEAARRAIQRCGSAGFPLPPEKYAQWREIEMTFNPENMRIR